MTAIALVGIWMIWIQALPALSMIGNYPLWGKADAEAVASATPSPMSPMVTASGSPPASTPPAVVTMEESPSGSVTISDFALAILIVVVTVVLFRNGSGLLEMSVLQAVAD